MDSTKHLHIGTIVQNAILFDPQQTRFMSSENILTAVHDLFTLLHSRNIKYVLVGGIALLQYIQGRNTEDIDLIITLSSLKKLPEITITGNDLYFARGIYQNLQIDFLLTKNPLFAYIQRHHTTEQQFVEQTISCATIDGLLLLKLYALPSLYRQGNFARVGLYENDIATLLYYHKPDMATLLAILTKYISTTDLIAIQESLTDIQKRITRFQGSEPDMNTPTTL